MSSYEKSSAGLLELLRNVREEEKMKKTLDKVIFLTLAGITAFTVNAQADITIYSGLEGGSGDVQNVLFNDFNSNDIALTIDGFLNQTDQIIEFTGTELLGTPSGGQARIVAADGSFTDLSFRMQDPTMGFDKVQFNIDSSFDGQITLIFTDQNNVSYQGLFELDDSGQNFFTAMASNNEIITSVTLNVSTGLTISDLAQVRLNPVSAAGVVAEPATMALVGVGMAGLGLLSSRRRKK